MNDYINSLKSQNKLNISIDKSIDFEWDYYKIAGPCSVEGPGIIDIANDLKIKFQIAYETGLESPGSYEDFDRIFWNKNKQDIVLALEKHLK